MSRGFSDCIPDEKSEMEMCIERRRRFIAWLCLDYADGRRFVSFLI